MYKRNSYDRKAEKRDYKEAVSELLLWEEEDEYDEDIIRPDEDKETE